MRRLANNENGGLLTVGNAGALWSSAAALTSIGSALGRFQSCLCLALVLH